MKRRATTVGRVILAVALTVGAGAVAALAIYIGRSTVDSFRTRTVPQREPALVGFDAFGQPVLDDWRLYRETIDGQEAGRAPWGAAVYLADASQRRFAWIDRMSGLGYDYRQSPLSWHLLYAGGQTGAYCFGFEQFTGRIGGFLGTAGFGPDPPPREEWFDAVLRDWENSRVDCLVGLANNRVYLIRFGQPRVDLIVDDLTTPICSIGSRPPRTYYSMSLELGSAALTALIPPDADAARGQTTSYSLAIRTADAIHIVDFASTRQSSALFNGEEDKRFEVARRRRFPLPEVLRNESFLVAPRQDGGLMIGIQRLFDVGSDRLNVSYRELKADGTLSPASQLTLKVSTQPRRERTWLLPLGSPALEAAAILAGQDAGWRDYEQVAGPLQWAVKVLWHYRIAMAVTLLIGGVLAVLCLRRQWRYRLSLVERIGWPLFVFLLGIPGWIGYRYSRRWPVLEDCETCHVPSPRDDEVCAVCASEFPLPTVQGTEILV